MKGGSQVKDRESKDGVFSAVVLEFMLSFEVELAKKVTRSFDCMGSDSNDCEDFRSSPFWSLFGGEGLGVGSHFHRIEKFIGAIEGRVSCWSKISGEGGVGGGGRKREGELGRESIRGFKQFIKEQSSTRTRNGGHMYTPCQL